MTSEIVGRRTRLHHSEHGYAYSIGGRCKSWHTPPMRSVRDKITPEAPFAVFNFIEDFYSLHRGIRRVFVSLVEIEPRSAALMSKQ